MWTDKLRTQAMFAAVNMANMCVGKMTNPMLPLHLGEVAGLLKRDKGEGETTLQDDLWNVALKLDMLAPEIEDERIRRWVDVTVDLAKAASKCYRLALPEGDTSEEGQTQEHFLMVLKGVEVALEQNPPVRGLGKPKDPDPKTKDIQEEDLIDDIFG